MAGEENRPGTSSPSFGQLYYQKFIEKFKYLTALSQIESHHIGYLKAVFLYGLQRKIRFPETFVHLCGARFLARKNSMDVAHLSNFFEPETTKLLLKLRPKQFIDVGAHVGRYSILLAKNGSAVVSFEPGDSNFRQLLKNIELNGLQNRVSAFNLGCSNVAESRDLYCVPSNEGMASFIKRTGAESKETHNLNRLDEVCANLEPDVIKIDVEGFELNVLKGAEKILKEKSPLLIIEIFEPQEENNITYYLSQLGYSIQEILDLRNFVFVKRTL